MTAFNSQNYLQLKRARKKKIRLILYCSLGAMGAAGFLYFLFFSGYFSVRAVSVSGVDSALAGGVKKNRLGRTGGERVVCIAPQCFAFFNERDFRKGKK